MGTSDRSSRDSAVRTGYLDRLLAQNAAALKINPNDPELRAKQRRLQEQKLRYQQTTGSTPSGETQPVKQSNSSTTDYMKSTAGTTQPAGRIAPGLMNAGPVSRTPTLDAFKAEQKATDTALFNALSTGGVQRPAQYIPDAKNRLAQGIRLQAVPPALSAQNTASTATISETNAPTTNEEKYKKSTAAAEVSVDPTRYASSDQIDSRAKEIQSELAALDSEYLKLTDYEYNKNRTVNSDSAARIEEISVRKAKLKNELGQIAVTRYYLKNQEQFGALSTDPSMLFEYSYAKGLQSDLDIVSTVANEAKYNTGEVANINELIKYLSDKYMISQEAIENYIDGGVGYGYAEHGYGNLWQLYEDLERRLKQSEGNLEKGGYDYETMTGYEKRIADAEAAQKKWADDQQYAKEHPVIASIDTVLVAPFQGLDYVKNSISTIGHNDVNDIENYIPMNSYNMTATNFVQAVRSQVSEDIEKKTDWELCGQNVASFLYQTGLSIADSAVLIVTTGSASVYFMGANAAAAKQKDILDSGGTNNQALWGGLAAGAAEVIFEKISVGNLLKTKNITDIRSLLNSTIKQAGVEASEEALTSISNIISDAVILGQNSDYNRAVQTYISRGLSKEKAEEKAMLDLIGQVVRASAGGLVSGGFMGGTVASFSGMTNNTTSRSAETESQLKQNTESQSANTSAPPQTPQEQAAISASQNIDGKKAEASNPTPAQSALMQAPETGESGALSNAVPQGDLTIGASTFARSGDPIFQALQNRQQEIQQARESWRTALFSRQPAAQQNAAASAEVSGALPGSTQAASKNALFQALQNRQQEIQQARERWRAALFSRQPTAQQNAAASAEVSGALPGGTQGGWQSALFQTLGNGTPPDSTVSGPIVDSPALSVDGKSPPGYTEGATEGAESAYDGSFDFKKFRDKVEAQKWGINEYSTWKSGLSAEETSALTAYTGDGCYQNINAVLRGAERQYTENNEQIVQQLSQALSKASVPKNITLFRGASKIMLGKYIDFPPEKLIGKVISDKAFMSTSLVGEGAFDANLTLVIETPEGAQGAYIGNMSYYPDEAEVLLNKGQQMVIKNVLDAGTPNMKIVVELIP